MVPINRKVYFVFLLIGIGNALFAQDNEQKLKALQKQFGQKVHEMQKEFRERPDVDSLHKAILALQQKSHNYAAFTINFSETFADVKVFNEFLVTKGIPPLGKEFIFFALAMSWKHGHAVSMLQFVPIVLNNKVSNDSLTVRVSHGNINYTWGYDFLNVQKLQFYPYIGFGMGVDDINLKKTSLASSTQSDPFNLFSKNNRVNLNSTYFALYTGAGLDFEITRGNLGGIKIGLRYVYQARTGKGKYKADPGHSDYDPKLKFNQGILVSLKFFGRQ